MFSTCKKIDRWRTTKCFRMNFMRTIRSHNDGYQIVVRWWCNYKADADFGDSDRKPTLKALAISIKFITFVYQIVTRLSFYLNFMKF